MLINLSEVFLSEGKQMTTTAELEMAEFKTRMGAFPITEKSPVSFTFTNNGVHKVNVKGFVNLCFATECDRCLIKVPTKLNIEFDREVTSPEYTADDRDDDDQTFMEGYQLDVEAFVNNEILTNWPLKILCKEECKGVCPVCGQNLNIKDCGCDTFVPDPRMAVLKDIFNANKEV